MALPLGLDIARAHLFSRPRQTAVSVLGVALGVGFFIGIAAMMQGFQRDFVAKVIDTQPHIVVKDEYRRPPVQPVEMLHPAAAVALRGLKPRDEVRGIRNARAIMAALAAAEGVQVAPTLSGQILLRFGSRDVSAGLTGIDPERERRVTRLEDDMVAGSLDELYSAANGIILGQGVADKAGVGLGELITAVSPEGVVMRMKVVGLFNTGVVAIDNFETYALLKKAQVLQDRPNVINRLRIRLDDVERAGAVAQRIERRFGYRAESWEEASRNVLGIFVIQNAIMYSTVGAILLVACFGIFNIVSTVVLEKTRDIAILRSMGFAEGDVKRIFVYEGFAVGIIGTVLGWLVGFGLVELLGAVEFEIEGFVKSQGFILYRTPVHYLTSGGFAILAATAAAWLPARKAARVNPVDIVRGAA